MLSLHSKRWVKIIRTLVLLFFLSCSFCVQFKNFNCRLDGNEKLYVQELFYINTVDVN